MSIRTVFALVLFLVAGVATAQARQGDVAYRFAASLANDGIRPAGSAAERRAHLRLAARFRKAGLETRWIRFGVPGHGRSRDLIGVRKGRSSGCLRIVMAHIDSDPPAAGAVDNGSGAGAIAELALLLGKRRPACEVWLTGNGAEERGYTGQPDHLGALALARHVRASHRNRLVYALSLDEVGATRSLRLRSPVSRPREAVEGELFDAARRTSVPLVWARDSSTGNSDHREFELLGMRGAVLQGLDNPCRHQACDTAGRLNRLGLRRAVRLVSEVMFRR